MTLGGYTNPIRSFERKMAPDFASREFRDPGLPRAHAESGLGSLRHTMPHLRRGATPHFDLGGPISRIYANSRPNLYNPDPRERQVLQAGAQMAHQLVNPVWRQNPGISSAIYAEGGSAAPDLQELMEPDENLSGPQQKEHEIVVEAMLALEGRHPNPGEAIKAFVDTFGPQALSELTEMMRSQAGGEEGEEEEEEPEGGEPAPGAAPAGPDEEDDLAAAGGGLLNGPGSGQSDEIEGSTPSGRPVLLSDGEYVIDAPTVAALGDGSTNAGARRLDDMRKKIRTAAYGHDKQAKPMKDGGQAILVDLGV
jgi:hypothetical protein